MYSGMGLFVMTCVGVDPITVDVVYCGYFNEEYLLTKSKIQGYKEIQNKANWRHKGSDKKSDEQNDETDWKDMNETINKPKQKLKPQAALEDLAAKCHSDLVATTGVPATPPAHHR